MDRVDYDLVMSDLEDGLSSATFMDHRSESTTQFQVGLKGGGALLLAGQRLDARLADLADIALAIYLADRLSPSRRGRCRHIHLKLPVRHPEIWENAQIDGLLRSILDLYTRDLWTFEFLSRVKRSRLAERSAALLSPLDIRNSVEIALWSGGLDALAGLYQRRHVEHSAESYVVVGTGGNRMIHRLQRRLFESALREFPTHAAAPCGLCRFPVNVLGTQALRKNNTPRARGILFLLLGSICAIQAKQAALHVYESGIGSNNLPYRASEVGTDHSKAVHPIAIRRVGELVSQICETAFTVLNPFEFTTKAQLCSALAKSGSNSVIHKSISCDRRLHARPTQCGRCSSCLLRRQALAVNGIIEPADRYACTSNTDARHPSSIGRSHINAMLAQVDAMRNAISSRNPWWTLVSLYPDLAELADEISEHDSLESGMVQSRLIALYHAYIDEWDTAKSLVSVPG